MKRYTCSFLILASLTGCATSSRHPAPPPSPKVPCENGGLFRQNNEGYSILYNLMSDESKVGGIFFIKRADPQVKSVIKELSLSCQAAKKRLEDFRASNNRLEFDIPDLPYMEKRSRDLEAREDRKVLLFSSGQQFELALIFTQAQAMNYAVNLTKALAEKESDPQRKAFLQDLTQQCTAYHERLMKLLSVHA